MIETLFYFFSAILVFSAIRVITSRSPVQAALFLILSFFSCSALWALLEAEFLAIILVLVYVGAVMVLFLFVVMMLDINIEKMHVSFVKYLPVGIIVGILLIAEVVLVIISSNIEAKDFASKVADYSNTKELGQLLYTEYLFAFELAAIVLLVALVAAVALVLKDKTAKNSIMKRQNINRQVRVNSKDRFYLADLPRGEKDD